MHSRLTIKIKKRSATGWFVWILVMMPFLFAFLNEFLGVPHAVRYLMDFSWIGLTVLMLLYKRHFQRTVDSLALWVILFLICTLLTYVMLYQSGLYYLWGFRNNFRFYAAFFLFVVFLKPKDGEDYLKLFDKIFWINAAVSMFQYFVLDLEGDYLGGVFFTEAGGNSYTNLFIQTVVTRSVVLNLEKWEKLGVCSAKQGTAVVVAAMAELKFFFVELVLVIILASLFARFSWRKLLVIVGGFLVVVLGAFFLTRLFPHFSDFFSYRWFLNEAMSAKGYTYDGDLNRLNAIPMINELWLKNWGQRLFGLGLGNCDTSAFSFLNTPFYKENSWLHYSWFSSSFLVLETGLVGLVLYVSFFILIFFAVRNLEHSGKGNMEYCQLASVLSLMCLILIIYNVSLRMESGYMIFFVLALPFIKDA